MGWKETSRFSGGNLLEATANADKELEEQDMENRLWWCEEVEVVQGHNKLMASVIRELSG